MTVSDRDWLLSRSKRRGRHLEIHRAGDALMYEERALPFCCPAADAVGISRTKQEEVCVWLLF